jgi:hypothetical protein
MIYLISYDLKKPGKDYTTLYEKLKSGLSWWHYLESTWLIHTNDTVEVWSDKIRSVIDENDIFIVIDVTKRPRQGWLPTKAWEWIREKESL